MNTEIAIELKKLLEGALIHLRLERANREGCYLTADDKRCLLIYVTSLEERCQKAEARLAELSDSKLYSNSS